MPVWLVLQVGLTFEPLMKVETPEASQSFSTAERIFTFGVGFGIM